MLRTKHTFAMLPSERALIFVVWLFLLSCPSLSRLFVLLLISSNVYPSLGLFLHIRWLLVTRPLLRNGGMAEDHGAPEVVERRRVRSCTVQNKMRDVLGRVSTGAAGRILDSANPREIRRLCPLQRRRERSQQA